MQYTLLHNIFSSRMLKIVKLESICSKQPVKMNNSLNQIKFIKICNFCSKIAVQQFPIRLHRVVFNNNNKKLLPILIIIFLNSILVFSSNYSTIFFPTCSFTCKKKSFLILCKYALLQLSSQDSLSSQKYDILIFNKMAIHSICDQSFKSYLCSPTATSSLLLCESVQPNH